ncbi:MAG: hypothetical protein VX694_09330 [Planctomycetota bacterium]|nr:hypothetical protein [Planctomycetota bacterium]
MLAITIVVVEIKSSDEVGRFKMDSATMDFNQQLVELCPLFTQKRFLTSSAMGMVTTSLLENGMTV